jgi:hypothetical protein
MDDIPARYGWLGEITEYRLLGGIQMNHQPGSGK